MNWEVHTKSFVCIPKYHDFFFNKKYWFDCLSGILEKPVEDKLWFFFFFFFFCGGDADILKGNEWNECHFKKIPESICC